MVDLVAGTVGPVVGTVGVVAGSLPAAVPPRWLRVGHRRRDSAYADLFGRKGQHWDASATPACPTEKA